MSPTWLADCTRDETQLLHVLLALCLHILVKVAHPPGRRHIILCVRRLLAYFCSPFLRWRLDMAKGFLTLLRAFMNPTSDTENSPSASELRDPAAAIWATPPPQLSLSLLLLSFKSSFIACFFSSSSTSSARSCRPNPNLSWHNVSRSFGTSPINFCLRSTVDKSYSCLSFMYSMISRSSWYFSSCTTRIIAFCFTFAASVASLFLLQQTLCTLRDHTSSTLRRR